MTEDPQTQDGIETRGGDRSQKGNQITDLKVISGPIAPQLPQIPMSAFDVAFAAFDSEDILRAMNDGGIGEAAIVAGQVENALRANAEMSSCWRAAFDVSRTSA